MLHVILSHDIFRALISTGYLTNILKLFVFYAHERGASFSESLKPADPRELFSPFWNKIISETKMEVLTTADIIIQRQPWIVAYLTTPQKYIIPGESLTESGTQIVNSMLEVDNMLGWLNDFCYLGGNLTVLPRPILKANFRPPGSNEVTPLDISRVKNLIADSYLNSRCYKRTHNVQSIIDRFKNTHHPTENVTDDMFYEETFGHMYTPFLEYVKDEDRHKEKNREKRERQIATCTYVLSKFGNLQMIPAAEAALSEKRFFDCFKEIQTFYLRLGVSSSEKFEAEVKSHVLQPGQDLNEHLTLVCLAIQRWNTVVFMEERTAAGMTVIQASDEITSHPAIPIDNSGELTDEEILATPHKILLLREAKRLRIYMNSLAPSPRFKQYYRPLINST
jgi:hypothetical protein